MEENIEHFRASGNLLRLLGEQLVSNKFIALMELVRNSYDADSTEVSLEFKRIKHPKNKRTVSSLVIKDNGLGMNINDITKKWLVLGTPNKESTKYSPGGRRVLGAKGIGRFSIQKLGKHSELQSISKENSKRNSKRSKLSFSIDWDRVIDPKSTIDEYDIEIIEDSSGNSKLGTVITIYDLREDWSEEDIERLKREISSMVPPEFSLNFKIKLSHWKYSPKPFRLTSALLDYNTYTIKGKADGKGKVSYIDDKGKGILDADTSECGPFSFEIITFDFGRIKDDFRGKAAKIQSALNDFHGIKIYRDDFRVKPYGDPGTDWLGLDKHRVNMVTRFGSQHSIGIIKITSKENPNLIDQTNREGIIAGRGLSQFRDTIFSVVNLLSIKNNKWHKENSTKSNYQDAASKAKKSTKGNPKAAEKVKDFIKVSNKIIRSLEETNSELRANASLGSAFLALGHDLLDETKLSRELVKEILTEPNDKKYVIENAKGLKSHLNIIHSFVQNLDNFGQVESKEVNPIRGDKVVKMFVKRFSPLLKSGKSKTNVELRLNAETSEVTISRRDIESILINLTTNSIQAMEETECRRKITIESFFKNGCWVFDFLDTGPGVDKSVVRELFERGVTTKKESGGSGIGLSIVKSILDSANGEIEVTESKNGIGAIFTVKIPAIKRRS
jgi:hypothetical protein